MKAWAHEAPFGLHLLYKTWTKDKQPHALEIPVTHDLTCGHYDNNYMYANWHAHIKYKESLQHTPPVGIQCRGVLAIK